MLFSVIALVSRTPLPWPKIVADFAVALAFGIMTPIRAKP